MIHHASKSSILITIFVKLILSWIDTIRLHSCSLRRNNNANDLVPNVYQSGRDMGRKFQIYVGRDQNSSQTILQTSTNLIHSIIETLYKKLISDTWAFVWDLKGDGPIILMSNDDEYDHTRKQTTGTAYRVPRTAQRDSIESLSAMLTSSAANSLSLYDDILDPSPLLQGGMAVEMSSTLSTPSTLSDQWIVHPSTV